MIFSGGKTSGDRTQEWRRLFSEPFGTFLLVLARAGAAVVSASSGQEIGRGAEVTAPALTVLAVILFMGKAGTRASGRAVPGQPSGYRPTTAPQLNTKTLVMAEDRSRAVATRFGGAPILRHRANDLLRASALPLLPPDDPEVLKDLKKVRKGKKLSPVLLVRGGLGECALTVADEYHRICASSYFDEEATIPCGMVDLPG
jgi:hypothetical protein